jgi:hypothetical protein
MPSDRRRNAILISLRHILIFWIDFKLARVVDMSLSISLSFWKRVKRQTLGTQQDLAE